MHRDRVYVHDVEDIRKMVLKETHDFPYAEHSGYQKTIVAVREEYYCLGMKNDVAEYISRCMECQQVKFKHRHPVGLLQPLPIPEWKWDVVTMDFIGKLPKTRLQNDAIMVVVDKLTKATHFIPVKTTHKATNIANIYMKEVARLHGISKAIVSDRDSKFTSNFWKGLFEGFGTSLIMITTYHLRQMDK